MGKAAAIAAAIVIISLLTAGCWSRQEVNDIGIVTATGIDRTKSGGIKVSLLLAVPRTVGMSGQAGGSGEIENTAGWVISEEGETIMDAFRNIQKKLPRNIFYPHNRAIVIGENLARNDTFTLMDFFQRSRQTQMRSFVLFTKKEAADILRFKPKFEKLTAEIIKEEMKTGVNAHVRLNEFINMFMEDGQEAYAPRIEIVPSEIKSASKEELNNLMQMGVGIMRDNRLVGWLNAEETRGLLWLRDEMEEGVITVNIPEKRGGGKISGEVQKAHTKIKVYSVKNRLRVDVRVTTVINIFENQSQISLKDLEKIAYVESLLEKDIEDRIRMSFKKAQQFNSDFVGIGRAIYKASPGLWQQQQENWNDKLADVEFQVSAKVNVEKIGMINEPISVY
ncbi:Ger(x)C family spore germination protein [Paenibacillus harenae]|uniref:Ger(x)C family spore germination protein n=1 Tax=Paenibacillus harenae TaxID=306543 RepID=UPI00042799BB|nr:Ger(x)C family spore germination protein [Paenibacillus harenae]